MGRFQLAIGHQKSQRVWIPVQQCSSTTFYLSLLISPGYKTWKCSTCGYGMRWAQCWFPFWIEWRGGVKHCKTAIICMTAVHVHDFDDVSHSPVFSWSLQNLLPTASPLLRDCQQGFKARPLWNQPSAITTVEPKFVQARLHWTKTTNTGWTTEWSKHKSIFGTTMMPNVDHGLN